MTHSGGKQHKVGDRGQRYEVSVFDPSVGKRVVFGWTDSEEDARAMVTGIGLHPFMTDAKFMDRFSIIDPVRHRSECRRQFKAFHQSLCQRFGYCHDEVYWWRDLVSLEEFVASRVLDLGPLRRALDFLDLARKDPEASEVGALRAALDGVEQAARELVK